MPFMWADTLLSAERAHLFRLLAWSATSVLMGTVILAWLRIGNRRSLLLQHFGLQTVGWGMVDATLVAKRLQHTLPRDLSAATRLDRLLWLNIGLDVGYILVGLTLLVAGWRLGRKLGVIGAGLGIVVQGAALALLDLMLAAQISR
ncbi:MAG: hypothetical protein ABJE47_08030 [bacterium]